MYIHAYIHKHTHAYAVAKDSERQNKALERDLNDVHSEGHRLKVQSMLQHKSAELREMGVSERLVKLLHR
jgi:hypothetical protein